jgi:hypothetical protein
MQQLKQAIISMHKKADWPRARRITKHKGGLPSNVLHDNYSLSEVKWKSIWSLYPGWAREILIFPEMNGQFRKGKDIVDSLTGWVVPWSAITGLVSSESIIGLKIGLFVDPGIDLENVQVELYKGKDATVVHPKFIKILTNFIQESGKTGKVDEETRIPIEVDPELLRNLPREELRELYRIDGIGVRPFVRHIHDFGHYEDIIINANISPYEDCGIAYVEHW